MRSWPVGRRVTSGWKTCPRATPGAARSDRPFCFIAGGQRRSLPAYNEGAKDPVVEPGASGLLEEIRADVLPHDLDPRASPRKCGRDSPRRSACCRWRAAARPKMYGLKNSKSDWSAYSQTIALGARIDLDHAREGRRMVDAVGAVVEDQDVAVGQRARDRAAAPAAGGPSRQMMLPVAPVDHHHGRRCCES